MAVLLEAISVIVRRATLEEKYPGGLSAYQRDCPNATFCMDAELTRIGFMIPPDVETFVGRLMHRGLLFYDDHTFLDIAVVDQFQGPTRPCSWLVAARSTDGLAVAWLLGGDMGAVAFPRGWKKENLRFVPNEDVAERLLPLAKEGTMDVVLDFDTGREVYVARPFPR
jgi:hypothetical protein